MVRPLYVRVCGVTAMPINKIATNFIVRIGYILK